MKVMLIGGRSLRWLRGLVESLRDRTGYAELMAEVERSRMILAGWSQADLRSPRCVMRAAVEETMLMRNSIRRIEVERNAEVERRALRMFDEMLLRELSVDVPGLSSAQIERLACLSEEAGELAHAVGKTLRHGYESRHPKRGTLNRSDIEREIGDLLAVMDLMVAAGDVRREQVNRWRKNKRGQLQLWMHHQPKEVYRS